MTQAEIDEHNGAIKILEEKHKEFLNGRKLENFLYYYLRTRVGYDKYSYRYMVIPGVPDVICSDIHANLPNDTII